MDSIIAIIFGIVQGLTEFIPVSSSGHLLILHEIFPNFSVTDEVAFDVALHVGTLAALLAYFWRDCWRYLSVWLKSFSQPRQLTTDQRLAWFIVLAILPAGFIGGLFENLIEDYFRNTAVVIVMLVAVAMLFLWVERRNHATGTMAQMRWYHALFIGVMQSVALIPGTSRSGITIVAGVMTKLRRDEAARFSFLIAIPLVFFVGLKKGVDLVTVGLGPEEVPVLLLGMLSAAVVGYLAIAGLLKYLSQRSLRPFAYYRIALAVLVWLVFYIV